MVALRAHQRADWLAYSQAYQWAALTVYLRAGQWVNQRAAHWAEQRVWRRA